MAGAESSDRPRIVRSLSGVVHSGQCRGKRVPRDRRRTPASIAPKRDRPGWSWHCRLGVRNFVFVVLLTGPRLRKTQRNRSCRTDYVPARTRHPCYRDLWHPYGPGKLTYLLSAALRDGARQPVFCYVVDADRDLRAVMENPERSIEYARPNAFYYR